MPFKTFEGEAVPPPQLELTDLTKRKSAFPTPIHNPSPNPNPNPSPSRRSPPNPNPSHSGGWPLPNLNPSGRTNINHSNPVGRQLPNPNPNGRPMLANPNPNPNPNRRSMSYFNPSANPNGRPTMPNLNPIPKPNPNPNGMPMPNPNPNGRSVPLPGSNPNPRSRSPNDLGGSRSPPRQVSPPQKWSQSPVEVYVPPPARVPSVERRRSPISQRLTTPTPAPAPPTTMSTGRFALDRERDQSFKFAASPQEQHPSRPLSNRTDNAHNSNTDQRERNAREQRLRRFYSDSDDSAMVTTEPLLLGKEEHIPQRKMKPEIKPFANNSKKSEAMVEVLVDQDEKDWSSVERILGTCPDMCPESERLERERKGDLDVFERFDGDRNHTNKDIAVKKYTRTPEKEPFLIRPLPVLEETMNYLLNLLNRGYYGDDLLPIHSFLWDRMRAIRMDLRMQHIFNRDAIAMHEQMIRFHILAMYELCEYGKGVGLSEGFDAHLNIEQMNKASVDLFQMYDDLRKQRCPVKSEAEFRGYYALLKLDKHPGYVVEPAELSLDLTKMTPSMRNSPEVQFAREVARACRMGNYLAFFRLARKATYLQACLMHAHFSKLRTQALESLNRGLQKNQGIPLAELEEWLAMEGEDIEALVQYHGFLVKTFDEVYMVKESSFLNSDKEFAIRRSKLVEEKRALRMIEDVLSAGQDQFKGTPKQGGTPFVERISSFRRLSDVPPAPVVVPVDEDMPDYEEDEQTLVKLSPAEDWAIEDNSDMISDRNYLKEPTLPLHEDTSLFTPETTFISTDQPLLDTIHFKQASCPNRKRRNEFHDVEPETGIRVPSFKKDTQWQENQGFLREVATPVEIHSTVDTLNDVIEESRDDIEQTQHLEAQKKLTIYDADARTEKLLRLARRWRLNAASRTEDRLLRVREAEIAISSLHIGLPVQSYKTVDREKLRENDISPKVLVEEIRNKRNHHLQRMWMNLDVLSWLAPILQRRNLRSKFLCWKLVLSTGIRNESSDCRREPPLTLMKPGDWLLRKLNANGRSGALPPSGVWYELTKDSAVECCVIFRDVSFVGNDLMEKDACHGASGLLFLISQGKSLDEELFRLRALVETIPLGSCLPLLILYSHSKNDELLQSDTLAKGLHLHLLDKSKVAQWLVLPITAEERSNGGGDFFDENSLKEGMSWLAEEAPLQPNLCCMHIEDLVAEYLSPQFNKLISENAAKVMPEICIRTFNEALLRAAEEVIKTARGSPPNWPPAEVDLVQDQRLGGATVTAMGFPETRWNESANVQPIVEALMFAQLPSFPPMTSSSISSQNWLMQKEFLETLLCQYVSGIGDQNNILMVRHFVDSMLQRGCTLQSTSSGLTLLPDWAHIFARIYLMRLDILKSEPPLLVCVPFREKQGTTTLLHSIATLHRGTPSLDEIIQMENRTSGNDCSENGNNGLLIDNVSHMDGFRSLVDENAGESEEPLVWSNSFTLTLPVTNSVPSLVDFEFPLTHAEAELDSMVARFCKKVDQEVAFHAKLKDEIRLLPTSSKVAYNARYKLESSVGRRKSPSSTSNSLTELVRKCEAMQASIDEKLAGILS